MECSDDLERVTDVVMHANKLKGLAARRQVLADTLKCCIVTEHEISAMDDPQLSDVAYDLDSVRGPLAVICRKRKPDDSTCPNCIIPIRCEGEVPTSADSLYTPVPSHVDLSLSAGFVDVYSSEELHQEPLPQPPFKVIRTIPWFDEFGETVHVSGSRGFEAVSRTVRASFCRLKKHYVRLSHLYSAVFTHHWQPLVAETKLQVLQRNFPKGVLGLRALRRTEDPKSLRALVMKQEDEVRRHGRHPHILGGKRLGSRFGETELDGIYSVGAVTPEQGESSQVLSAEIYHPESKHASIPDLKQTWNVAPGVRVSFLDRNRKLCESGMADIERETSNAYPPWTISEVRTFLERLGTYGKNFRKIAISIGDKSEKDCADFYFRFKIVLNMKMIVNAGISQAARKSSGRSSESTAVSNALPSPSAGGHRVYVDEILDLVSDEVVFNQATLERLNKKFQNAAHVNALSQEKRWPELDNRDERKNAIIDILAVAISRGHASQLGIFEPSQRPAVVVLSNHPPPKLTLQTIAIVKPIMAAFSVVKTDTAVLVPRTANEVVVDPPPAIRQLQSHNTI